MYAQIVDDYSGHTIVSASTLDPELSEELPHGGNMEAAERVGELVAQRALENDVEEVVFDRAGYDYHGRVAAVAEAAREEGLKF
jgi:large subunit ribosomal protein L18